MSAHERKSIDDWRKEQALQEARKAGQAEALKDEDGRDINPHIPNYIVNAPWYLNPTQPSLKHQRVAHEQKTSIHVAPTRGVVGRSAGKFRKGACTNCGAMTHKAKDCVERPRKVGARWSNKNIAPDEIMPEEGPTDYAAKRDRWSGYDPERHKQQIELFELREQEMQRRRAEQPAEEEGEETKPDSAKVFTVVRNLRVREDTAKYLYNLDPKSAHYDPKTRSMRVAPIEGNPAELEFAGDNFVKMTGEAADFARTAGFSVEAQRHGQEINMFAAPSQAEAAHRSFLQKKESLKQSKKSAVTDRYGAQDKFALPDKELLQQGEQYAEYSRTGRVIKGAEPAKALSKYVEDVLTNGHTTVWGSFWRDGKWGYACCHSMTRNAYCTGEAGKAAVDAEPLDTAAQQAAAADDAEAQKPLVETFRAAKGKSKRNNEGDGDDDEAAKAKRLKEALEREEKRLQTPMDELDDRKRRYNSMAAGGGAGIGGKEIADEEMEAYYLKRMRADDPMANYKGEEDD